MCLATAYTDKGGTETVIAQYVAKVEFRDGNVVLTDILGQETVVEGTLKNMDLSKNTVEISCPA